MLRKYRYVLSCFLSLGLTLATSSTQAGTPLLIWPIDPVIESSQRATALWLENQGSEPATLQVRIFDWNQDGHQSNYLPQQLVIPSPPIATIAPGGRQLVRLMSTQPPMPGTERALRIFIDELPTSGNKDPVDGGVVKLQLRYAVPLFVYGAGARPPLTRSREGVESSEGVSTQPVVQWTSSTEAGQHFLLLRNTGMVHGRVTEVEWSEAGKQVQSVNPGLLGYVLAGSTIRFPVAIAVPRKAQLRARLNGRAASLTRVDD